MGTLNAIYIRADNPTVATAIRAVYPSAYTEPESSFFAIDQQDDHFRCPEGDLQAISARLKTEVIWLSFQSVVDAFQYHHWQAGTHVRSLVYGCFENEREWERADGIAQPWEAEVFFGDLESALQYQVAEDDRREIERVYRGHLVEVGAFEPSLDAREAARSVAKFFRLPGWSLAEGNAG